MKRTIREHRPLFVGLFVAGLCGTTLLVHAGEPGINGASLNGDTNCDGGRDLSDAVLLLNWLFLGGNRPCALADTPHLVERVAESACASLALRSSRRGVSLPHRGGHPGLHLLRALRGS